MFACAFRITVMPFKTRDRNVKIPTVFDQLALKVLKSEEHALALHAVGPFKRHTRLFGPYKFSIRAKFPCVRLDARDLLPVVIGANIHVPARWRSSRSSTASTACANQGQSEHEVLNLNFLHVVLLEVRDHSNRLNNTTDSGV